MNPQPHQLRLDRMTEADAHAISYWRYPPPYDRLRWPDWHTMLREGREFADPGTRDAQYRAVRDADGALIGYVQFFPLDRTIRIGLGLRPDRCDQGIGTHLMPLIVQEAQHRMPGGEIDLEVEQSNKRAIRVYEKTGFRITDTYTRLAAHGEVAVYCMVWQTADPDV